MNLGTGLPPENGSYCVEIYHGWRVLDYFDGRWYYQSNFPVWAAGDPVQWIGPLPARKEMTAPKIEQTPALEFDL